MKLSRFVTLLSAAVLTLTVVLGLRGTVRGAWGATDDQASRAASGATAKAVAAANAFLATLDDTQRAKARIDLTEKARANWSNLPTGTTFQTGATERNGMKLGDMNAAQQEAALALVAAPLSRTGFQKVMNIVNADQALEEKTTRKEGSRVRFGRAEYYVAILGTPSDAAPWMIQFGGHHLAINVTVSGGNNTLTPSHTGAQPATYTLDGQTIRPLGNENDKAFALINALDATLQKQAVLGYQVKDTVAGPGLDGKVIQPEGVRVSGFNTDQRAKLLDLIGEWVGILNEDAAAARTAEIKTGLGDTYFAWSGPTTNGSPAYFRIQGPAVLIEYAPQGGGTDHIHTFYRDPTNDYGVKFTRK
jgi:Protein of unknown function (DUF3500)